MCRSCLTVITAYMKKKHLKAIKVHRRRNTHFYQPKRSIYVISYLQEATRSLHTQTNAPTIVEFMSIGSYLLNRLFTRENKLLLRVSKRKMIKKCLRTFRQSTCLVTVAKEYFLIKFQALIVYEQHFFI